MKKNQIDKILNKQTHNKKTIAILSSIAVVVLILSVSFLLLYFQQDKTRYVKYTETSDLSYDVYLKENNFFENEFIESDNQYISELIDYIKANFKYELDVEEKDVDYTYSYKVLSEVTVKEKNTNKNIYKNEELLLEKKQTNSYNNSHVNINEVIDINYNKYNELIKNFVSVYGLEDIESTLDVKMYISVIGNCDDIENPNTESIISLSIPLTTKTVSIDMKYDLTEDSNEKIMLCKNNSNERFISLILSVILLIVDICIFITILGLVRKNRTAETIYDKQLKKILYNYGSYIQKVEGFFDLTGYKPLRISEFNGMLEIRETINQPILMVENENKDGVHFIIPTNNTGILYIYTLKVSEIKKELEEKQNEDF